MGGWDSLLTIWRDLWGDKWGDVPQYISGRRAMQHAAVKHCVEKISGHIGQLPLNLHKRTKDRNEMQPKHPAWKLLKVRPNKYQTPFEFKRLLELHRLLWGNGRAYIHRSGGMDELIPLSPDRCETCLVEGEKVHFYKMHRDERLSLWQDIKAEVEQARRENRRPDMLILEDADVLHISGVSFDGVSGLSVLSLAARSFSVGLSQEATEAKRLKKGYAGGLMLNAPSGAFRKESDAKQFLEEFREAHTGDDAEVVGLLREGITAQVMQMSNSDAQFLESRKFDREQVMLWFSMPTMPGDQGQSYASLEQKNLSYGIDCLGPRLTSWEQEAEAKLLTEGEVRNGYYFKFNDGAIHRTDKQTTATVAATLASVRMLNPNEGRAWFDMNPYEGGDEFENPNITPGAPGATQESEQDENQETSDPPGQDMQNRAAWVTVIEDMIGVEVNRVCAACKAKNFVDKIDAFYEGWESRLADKLEAMMLDRGLSSTHCAESKRRLLAVADDAKSQEQLAQLVAAETRDWKQRVYQLMELAEC